MQAINYTGSHLKSALGGWVQGQGGAEFQPADILKYFNCLKQGLNAGVGPKNIFEIVSNNTRGFTLIELIAVMVILGVMASVAVKKLDLITDTASDRALLEVTKELNVRETIIWTKIKWTGAGWKDDGTLFATLDTDMGPSYVWTAGPNANGGTVAFKSKSVVLTRTPSTSISMGSWK